MGLEEELNGFVKPYQGLLRCTAEFINPFLTEEKAITSVLPKELEEKRKQFLKSFKQLPFPKDAKMIRAEIDEKFDENHPIWQEIRYFCTDLTVYGLHYDQYRIGFYLENKKIPLGDQAPSLFLRRPVPGNILSGDVTVYFKPPIDIDWEEIKSESSRLLQKSPDPIIYRSQSESGLIESNWFHNFNGYFLSTKRMSDDNPPAINLRVGGRSKKREYSSIVEASFDLRRLGYGELGAFMKHIGLEK